MALVALLPKQKLHPFNSTQDLLEGTDEYGGQQRVDYLTSWILYSFLRIDKLEYFRCDAKCV